jgi:hypothetical protein
LDLSRFDIHFVFREIIKKTHYMVADPAGYDDHLLYEYELSMNVEFQLVCPVHRYKNTPSEQRLQLVDFYESVLGLVIIYPKRGTSIEPC